MRLHAATTSAVTSQQRTGDAERQRHSTIAIAHRTALCDRIVAIGRCQRIGQTAAREKRGRVIARLIGIGATHPASHPERHRLERRAEDSAEVIAKRLKNAAEEIPHWNEYDYVLVNRDLDKSFVRLRAILTAERLKRVLKPNLEGFVGELLADLKKMG